jgi:hypothetical protein
MKKLVLFATAVMIVSVTSCRKNWECECIVNGEAITPFEIKSQIKRVAETHCNDQQKTLQDAGKRAGCELK